MSLPSPIKKITPIGKSGHDLRLGKLPKFCGPLLGELPRLWVFPFNIYTMAEASDFKFGTQLGFAKAHHITTHRGKWACPWAREAPIYLGFPFNIFATAALFS